MRIRHLVLYTSTCFIFACQSTAEKNSSLSFTDVTDSVGLSNPSTTKYGGPTVADINHDGAYDLILTNHTKTPPMMFWGQPNYHFVHDTKAFLRRDTHGTTVGDYDLDGDADAIISIGGGAGNNPKSARFHRNDNGKFVDITEKVGILDVHGRGRSVRFLDLDGDGDLDLLHVNAKPIPANRHKPRNFVFENTGDGQFVYRKSPGLESVDAERVLLTDFNQDNVLDLVLFTPLSLWQNNGDFTFKEVTRSLLPASVMSELKNIVAAANPDIDNDGYFDLYLARGKFDTELNKDALEFDRARSVAYFRDLGANSRDGFEFNADNSVTFKNIYIARRKPFRDTLFPLFLGANRTVIENPESGDQRIDAQQAEGFPKTLNENGWYIGHLGEGKWRIAWVFNGDIAWHIRGELAGINDVKSNWQFQPGLPDILLRHNGRAFEDASKLVPEIARNNNNHGVTFGDFDNDGLSDVFLYNYGGLKYRSADVLLRNTGKSGFVATSDHGATAAIGEEAHGDMGAAFDYNMDGALDILSGDSDNGRWHLYQNQLKPGTHSNYVLVRVGYSATGIDPLGAKLIIETANGRWARLVGSAGASHSQSALSIAHFGLGSDKTITKIHVRWRDGSTETIENVAANQLLKVGHFQQQASAVEQ